MSVRPEPTQAHLHAFGVQAWAKLYGVPYFPLYSEVAVLTWWGVHVVSCLSVGLLPILTDAVDPPACTHPRMCLEM